MKLNFKNDGLSEIFSEKRKRLSTARRNLKAYFVGLDPIIDSVIDKITAWYLFPTIATRPLIINLWGMTGVGKTDLIRRLVKELNFSDMFMELQMCSTGSASSWEKSLQSKLLRSDIEPGLPGILLLDEFQRFRTVDEDGRDIRDYLFQDLWALLSDGRFGLQASLRDELTGILCDALYDDSFVPIKKKKKKDEDEEEEEKQSPFKRRYWRARQLKRLLDVEDDVKEIMQWGPNKLIEMVTEIIDNPNSYKEVDYSKLLIFVSGNLDEAFRSAIKVSEADQDADLIKEQTSKINLVTIKDALAKRFRPEQISRLGSIHIIYPSLSKENFEDIIIKKVNEIESLVEDQFGVSLLFSDSVKKLIYNNGVFPAQGVRPLLSTIDDIYNTCIPPILISALENNKNTAVLEFQNNVMVGHIGKPIQDTVEVSYQGVLDQIRAERLKKVNSIYNAAVHEAGHTLIFALLFGYAPPVVSVNLTSSHSDGVTYTPPISHCKESLLDDICVDFGGICAETLIFGEDHPSNGSWSDLQKATKLAANAVRHYNFDSCNSYVMPITSANAHRYNTEMVRTSEIIEEIVTAQKSRCMEFLARNRSVLIALSDALIKSITISGKEIVDICAKFDITCKVSTIGMNVIHEYRDAYREYKKKYTPSLPPTVDQR